MSRRMRALSLVLLGAAWLGLPAPASAQLFGTEGLDPKFCEQATFRQTVVYVDDTILVDGRTEWAGKLTDKMRATLAPGERVTVVRLSPTQGSSREIWAGCWPAFTEAEVARIRSERYLFSRSPLDRLSDQQKYFFQKFGDALTQIYKDAKRPAAQVRFSAANAPPKQILRALAADEGRFTTSKVTIRAILYSDMVENSDLGSTLKPPGPAENYGQKLGTYLRRAVFYMFGVGEDLTESAGFGERARVFWTAALRSMAATVGGFGSDLNVPNILPTRSVVLPVEVSMDGQLLDGRLSLLTNDTGDLVDSWIGISRLSSALLSGTYRCKSAGQECRLDSTTTSGLTTNSPSEVLSLSGVEQVGMKGQLGVRGSRAMFDVATLPPAH